MTQLANSTQLAAETVVIATQLSQNAEAIRQVLEVQGLPCVAADSIAAVTTAIRAEAGLVVITEELLSLDPNFEQLVNGLNQQPEWSDIPVIFLLKDCRHFPTCMARLHASRHQHSITMLEMPLKRREFHSIVQSCLTHRRRQFQLRDTLRQLNESNQALEGFSHTVAHELRNPLGIVTGSLDLLQKKPLEEREEKLVQMSLRTARKMDQILTTLLQYGKLKSRRDLPFEPVDMNLVVERAVTGLRNIIEAHQAVIDWEHLPVVIGNANLLENLVSNLIKNALIHKGMAVPMVTVTSQQRGDRGYFQIVDNGAGIAAADQQKIFELFARVGQRRTEGSGIGLALCQRIVQQHGGSLGVESALGQGSTFYFDLPIGQGEGDRRSS